MTQNAQLDDDPTSPLSFIPTQAARDFASLKGLSPPHLQALSATKIAIYESIQRDVAETLQRLRTIYNNASPLHVALPPEVIANVFRQFSPSTRTDIRVSHVCVYWRELVHRTPQFWQDMLSMEATYPGESDESSPDVSSIIQSFIDRAAPLSFDFHVNTWNNVSEPVMLEATDLPRLRTLVIKHAGDFPPFLEHDLPLLEVLECNFDAAGMDFESRVGKHHFPRLHTICTDLEEFVPAIAPPSLRHLQLNRIRPHMNQFLDILEPLQALESLTLVKFKMREDESPGHRVVRLPRLARLHLTSSYDTSHFIAILSLLSLPPTALLEVDGMLIDHSTANQVWGTLACCLAPSAHRNIQALRASLSPSSDEPQTRCTLELLGFSDAAEPRACILRTRMPACWAGRNHRGNALLRGLAAIFGPQEASLRVLDCDLNFSVDTNINAEQWGQFFAEFPNLKCLKVTINSCNPLMRFLLKNPTVLTALGVLEVHHGNGSSVHETFPSVVEAREEAGMQRLRMLSVRGPLDGKPFSEARKQRLRTLVSEVLILP